ncbi:hypothetical protein HYH03_013976 [Edaphochlamys debaryana]|uniref:Uncharacterized protein n=1 Tax=Edaphochlamys debaryana TaxID=47281 RepID=A0A836BSS2_9CHLO|nr:hypothetical protein HYH03_013976 [Edaphochlamys debaryana]|eukprot:KAG2487407.1 hypothetical protein HYH03_013976 [Edaphochlamys debaryana]
MLRGRHPLLYQRYRRRSTTTRDATFALRGGGALALLSEPAGVGAGGSLAGRPAYLLRGRASLDALILFGSLLRAADEVGLAAVSAGGSVSGPQTGSGSGPNSAAVSGSGSAAPPAGFVLPASAALLAGQRLERIESGDLPPESGDQGHIATGTTSAAVGSGPDSAGRDSSNPPPSGPGPAPGGPHGMPPHRLSRSGGPEAGPDAAAVAGAIALANGSSGGGAGRAAVAAALGSSPRASGTSGGGGAGRSTENGFTFSRPTPQSSKQWPGSAENSRPLASEPLAQAQLPTDADARVFELFMRLVTNGSDVDILSGTQAGGDRSSANTLSQLGATAGGAGGNSLYNHLVLGTNGTGNGSNGSTGKLPYMSGRRDVNVSNMVAALAGPQSFAADAAPGHGRVPPPLHHIRGPRQPPASVAAAGGAAGVTSPTASTSPRAGPCAASAPLMLVHDAVARRRSWDTHGSAAMAAVAAAAAARLIQAAAAGSRAQNGSNSGSGGVTGGGAGSPGVGGAALCTSPRLMPFVAVGGLSRQTSLGARNASATSLVKLATGSGSMRDVLSRLQLHAASGPTGEPHQGLSEDGSWSTHTGLASLFDAHLTAALRHQGAVRTFKRAVGGNLAAATITASSLSRLNTGTESVASQITGTLARMDTSMTFTSGHLAATLLGNRATSVGLPGQPPNAAAATGAARTSAASMLAVAGSGSTAATAAATAAAAAVAPGSSSTAEAGGVSQLGSAAAGMFAPPPPPVRLFHADTSSLSTIRSDALEMLSPVHTPFATARSFGLALSRHGRNGSSNVAIAVSDNDRSSPESAVQQPHAQYRRPQYGYTASPGPGLPSGSTSGFNPTPAFARKSGSETGSGAQGPKQWRRQDAPNLPDSRNSTGSGALPTGPYGQAQPASTSAAAAAAAAQQAFLRLLAENHPRTSAAGRSGSGAAGSSSAVNSGNGSGGGAASHSDVHSEERPSLSLALGLGLGLGPAAFGPDGGLMPSLAAAVVAAGGSVDASGRLQVLPDQAALAAALTALASTDGSSGRRPQWLAAQQQQQPGVATAPLPTVHEARQASLDFSKASWDTDWGPRNAETDEFTFTAGRSTNSSHVLAAALAQEPH